MTSFGDGIEILLKRYGFSLNYLIQVAHLIEVVCATQRFSGSRLDPRVIRNIINQLHAIGGIRTPEIEHNYAHQKLLK